MTPTTNTAGSTTQQLTELAESADRVLLRCKAVFPFDFFPDSITISQNKVTIVYSDFFFMKSVHTVLIENILTVQASVGPIFASLLFEVNGFQQSPPEVTFLAKSDAVKAQEIIMGLVAAKHEGINLTDLKTKVVKNQINQIGATKEDVTGI